VVANAGTETLCENAPVVTPGRPTFRRCSLLVAAALVAAPTTAFVRAAGRPALPISQTLPVPLGDYLARDVKLTAEQQSQLVAGRSVTKLLDADPAREVAIFGGVWVAAPAARYVAALRDIERFEQGGAFRVTRKISSPPRLEDFADLRLPGDDLDALRSCRVGQCELKLSQAALDRVRREIDWKRPTARADVEALARRIALEYVQGYLEGGNARLAVYRDSDRPTFVADELKVMIAGMPALTTYLPDLQRYLLDFPTVTIPGEESFIYWQEARFGLKPTIRINHVVIAEQPTHVAVASKLLYASHYFWTALELRVLVPDAGRGTGFWYVSVSRSRSDGLSGFVGRLIRGRVRGEAEKGMMAALQGLKAALERPGQ
jgi:hypothetical protein